MFDIETSETPKHSLKLGLQEILKSLVFSFYGSNALVLFDEMFVSIGVTSKH